VGLDADDDALAPSHPSLHAAGVVVWVSTPVGVEGNILTFIFGPVGYRSR